MADSPRYPETGEDTGVGSDRGSTIGTPRWVKVFGIVVTVVVLLLVGLMLFGGGDHGPSRHAPGGEPAEQVKQEAPGDRAPPEGGHR